MIEVAGGIILAMIILAFLPLVLVAAVVLFWIAVTAVIGVAAWYIIFVEVPRSTVEEAIVTVSLSLLLVWMFYTIFKDRDSKRVDESKPECPVAKATMQRDSKGRFLKREVS